MRELAGRSVLVTGAAGGIGAHIARALAAQGMALVLSGRNAAALEELRDELRARGARADVVTADLSRRDEVNSLIPRAEAALGPLDVLVNNAGIEISSRFVDVSEQEVDEIVAINLVAPMLLIRTVLPGMVARGRGHVVSIASVSGKLGLSCNEHYGATKAALIRLTHGLRAEYRDSPIGFSVISPGFTSAGMLERMERETGVRAPKAAGIGPPEKVAEAVVKAIRADLPDVTVNPVPLSPVLALGALAPRLFERVAMRIAPHLLFERTAEQREAPRDG